MKTIWAKYLEVLHREGDTAGLSWALKHMDRDSEDFKSVQRWHAPTRAQLDESRARRAVIASDLNPEVVKQNCRF